MKEKLKRWMLLIAGLLAVSLFHGCAEDEPEAAPRVDERFQLSKSEVAIFEIATLETEGVTLSGNYAGSLAGEDVELLKTSDTTLTFVVPEVAEGEHFLEFGDSRVKIKVKALEIGDPEKMVTAISNRFDEALEAFIPLTEEETAEIGETKQFKDEVMALFASLSVEDQRRAMLFYEANKAPFHEFINSVSTQLDGDATMRMASISDCPETDFLSFYGCTAENLDGTAQSLMKPVGQILWLGGLAGGLVWKATPATLGLSMTGATLAMATAALIYKFEAKPAYMAYKRKANAFLAEPWILNDEPLFENLTTKFTDGGNTALGLNPVFRSLREEDHVTTGTSRLIRTMQQLRDYWTKIGDFFGDLPAFKDQSTPATLYSDELQIGNVSNPDVKYLGHEGQMVKFQSLSGEEEDFTYDIAVNKEGFSYSIEAQGTVLAFDSIAYYKSILKGNWVLTFATSSEQNFYTFDNVNFTGQWYGGITSAGDPYTTDERVGKVSTWTVMKDETGYYIQFILINRGWRTSAYIKGPGILLHRNTFNI